MECGEDFLKPPEYSDLKISNNANACEGCKCVVIAVLLREHHGGETATLSMDLRMWVFGLLCSGYSVGAMGGAVLPEEAGKPNALWASKGSISLCRQSSGGRCRQAEGMYVVLCMCFIRNTESCQSSCMHGSLHGETTWVVLNRSVWGLEGHSGQKERHTKGT